MPHTYSLQWLLQSTDLQNFEVLSWQIFQLPGRFHNRAPMVPQALVVPRKLQEVIPKSFKVIAHTQKKNNNLFYQPGSLRGGEDSQHGPGHRWQSATPPTFWVGQNIRICQDMLHSIFYISSSLERTLDFAMNCSTIFIWFPLHTFSFNHTFLFGRYIRGLQMGTGPWIKSELSRFVIKIIWTIMKSYEVQQADYQEKLNEVIYSENKQQAESTEVKISKC